MSNNIIKTFKKRLILHLFLLSFFLLLVNCQSNSSIDGSSNVIENPEPIPFVDPLWSEWIRENSFSLDSAVYNNSFEDLKSLKPFLKNRRIVQLGESSHGVKEYNQVKVKIIKFLHEEMNFNVIAFESSIFECYYGYKIIRSLEPETLMCNSIFGVWHTDEVIELFEYIYSTLNTDRPLILSGFDTQCSGGLRVYRPEFIKNVLYQVDSEFADKVFKKDTEILNNTFLSNIENIRNYFRDNSKDIELFYLSIIDFIDKNKKVLTKKNGDIRSVLMVRQVALSRIRYLKQVLSGSPENTLVRDEGMANNLDFLLDIVYPDEKIITWGHNAHLRHANEDAIEDRVASMRTMGSWVCERHRPILYTIGLYMYGGQAAYNNGVVHNVETPLDNSLEAICNEASGEFVYVDMFHQSRSEGNSWMFIQVPSKRWGVNDQYIVPRDQYDAVILVKTAHPPDHYKYVPLIQEGSH